MAWWDFIKAIRQNDDEERRRDQEGGARNAALGFIDDMLDRGGDAAKATGRAAYRATPFGMADETEERANESIIDILKKAPTEDRWRIVEGNDSLRQKVEEKKINLNDDEDLNRLNEGPKSGEKVATGARDFLIGTGRSILRTPETAIRSTMELGGDIAKTVDNIGASPEERARNEEADKRMNMDSGSPTDPIRRFLYGSEDVQTYQTRGEGNKKVIEESRFRDFAGPLAFLGTGLTVASDLPTGAVTKLGKKALQSVGKEGIEKLAKEGTEQGVKELIGDRIPKEVLDEVAPRLAKATDDKAVTEILGGIGARGTGKIDDIVDAAKPSSLADSGGLRQYDDIQKQVEAAHNAGRDDLIDGLLEKIPAADRAGIDPRTPTGGFMMDPVTKKLVPKPAAKEMVEEITPAAVKTGPQKYGEDADEILGQFRTTSQIEKEAPQQGFKQKFEQQFFDKLSPLNRLVRQVEGRVGRKLTTEENPYELGRLYAGTPAAVKQRVEEVADALEQSGDVDAVRILGTARRILGRSDDYKGAITPEKASRAVEQLRTKLGEEGFQKANLAVDRIVQYNETLLKELGDSGVLSPEAVEEIIKRNPDYFARFQSVAKLLEAQGRDIFRSGQSFNLSRQNVVKALDGMQEGSELLDPIEAVIKATDLSMRTMSRNRIWQSMDDLADTAPDLIFRVRDPENVTERIALSLDNKEMVPIRNKVDRFIKTRNKSVRRLQSQIDRLEKQGMDISLKTPKQGAKEADAFRYQNITEVKNPKRTTKNPPTMSDISAPKQITGTATERLGISGGGDTKSFVESLITLPNKEIVRLKKMVGTRDANMTKILDEIQGLKGEYDDLATKIGSNREQIKELADLDVPEGYDVIAGFRNGVQGKLAIPKEIADVYKGMTPSQMNYLTKVVGGVNRVMKESVTSLSLPFAFVRNPIRDFKAMASNSQNIPAGVHSLVGAWTKGFASALKKDDIYQRWIKSGGGGAGIYADVDSAEKIAKDAVRKVNGPEINSAGDLFKEAARFVTAPVRGASRAVQKAGATLEAAPRLAEFQAAVNKGVSDDAAAFASRNVTVDFNQSGTVGQVMNQWVPFLNARLQGNKKLLEAAKNNPARFAAVYTTLTAAPIVATVALNQQFKEVLEQIDQNTKNNNFLIILGDEKDEKGNFKQVIKIPKGDMDKIFGNPLENFVNYMAGNDSKGFAQVVTEMVGSTLPVDVVKDGEVNVSRAVGGVLPVAAKIPVEWATNRNLYYDNPIVPDSLSRLPDDKQVRTDKEGNPKVNPVDQFVSQLTGTSPIKVQNARQSLTGQLISKDPASQLQGSVVGASDNAPTNAFYKIKKDVDRNRASASKYINESIARGDVDAAYAAAEEYNKYLRESYSPFAEKYGKYMTEDLIEQYEGLKINLNKRSVKQRRRSQLEKAGN